MGLISSLMGEIIGKDVDLGDLYTGLGTAGSQAQVAAGQLAEQLPGMTAFRPFTVSSGTSQVMATPEGGFNIGLSPAAQAQQDVLRRQANYYLTQPVQGVNELGQLGQMAGGLGAQFMNQAAMPTGMREAQLYGLMRGMQMPEEQRQQLALEERLAQQGRLGVRTAMYGGTPEQLAMAKAQEEAQDRASLAAMQQAQAERQQAVSEAQTFGGLFGQQAGLSSQLQSAAQQRATQLSQLGLSAEQMQAQLEQEGFGRQMQLGQAGMQAQQAQAQLEAQRFGQQMQLGQAGIGAAQAQSALQTQAQQRAAQLSQLGLSAQQIESQLQSEGLGRAATSAQQAAQLAQLAGGLQAQQAGLGAQYAGLGSQLAMQDLAAQQAQQQLALGALAGSYIPQAQLLNVAQLGMTPIEMAQRGQLYGAGLFGEGSMAGLQSRLAAALGQANLFGTVGTGLLSGALGVKI